MRPTRRQLALVLLFVVVGSVALVSGQQWTASTDPMPTARRVLVVGIGPLGFDDLHRGATPRLDALVDGDGAVAALSTRTRARRSTLEEGYLSLGAGARLRGSTGDSVAYDADELAALPDLTVDAPAPAVIGPVSVVGADDAIERNPDGDDDPIPGALAAALHAAGRSVAVVGNADQVDPTTGLWRPRRPAALAAMGPDLLVDAGVVARGALLSEDPQAPFAVRASVEQIVTIASSLLVDHDVVFVEPGDLSRVDAWAAQGQDELLEADVDAARAAALARTDAVLGALLDDVPDDVLVMAVSLAAPGPDLHLAPLALAGPGATPGSYLVSPSTKRAGVVAVTDLAPTILAASGTPVPEDLVGRPLEVSRATADLDRLERLDDETAFRERSYGDWTRYFIDLHVVVYALAVFALLSGARGVRPLRSIVRVAGLALAAFPLATFVVRLLPTGWTTASWSLLLVLVLTFALVGGASSFRRNALSPLVALMAATVGVLFVDAATGTHLQLNTWLGISLHNGARFYGLGNTAFGLLTAGALLVVASWVGRARPERRDDVLLAGALLLILVALAEGAPSLGSDVGGILTIVPAAGALVLVLSGRGIDRRAALGLAGATVAVLGAATAVDLLRPAESRTHLGRFASDALKDPSTVWDTVHRKVSSNLDLFGTSPWVRLLLVTVAFLAVVLLVRERRALVLPAGSAERVGVAVTVGAALLGLAVNDSGPIVPAMFCIFVLPYVLLRTLEQSDRTPEVDASSAPEGVDEAVVGTT